MIAAVVVALIVAGGWWHSRPNLDPRFVGDWEYYAVKNLAPDDGYTEADPVILKLSADGAANSRDFERLGFSLVDWWIDHNGHFVLLARHDGQRNFSWQLESAYSRVMKNFHNAQIDRWMIDNVAEGKIALRRFGDPNAHLLLRRVSSTGSVR